MQESNADRRVRQFQWAIKLAFLAATLIFAVALIKLFQTGLNIDTNLRSLAPQAAQDSLGEQLINQLSGAASHQRAVCVGLVLVWGLWPERQTARSHQRHFYAAQFVREAQGATYRFQ